MELTRWVYDIECYPNFFCANFISAEADKNEMRQFVVWHDPFDIEEPIDEIMKLLSFLAEDNYYIGFNNRGYDDVLLHAALNLAAYDAETFCGTMKELSNRIINNEIRKVPEADRIFESLDLYLLWHFNNIARSMSLKAVEAAIKFENIQDLPYPPDEFVDRYQMTNLVTYCWNDVRATKAFYHWKNEDVQEDTQAMIKMREILTEQYGYDFTNSSASSLGERIFLDYMSKSLGIPSAVVSKWKTARHIIDLESIIFDYVKFESVEFNRVLDEYKTMLLINTLPEDGECDPGKKYITPIHTGFSQSYGGVIYEFGLGGLHAVVAGVHEPEEDEMIVTLDVASYYPNLAIKNNLFPEHLSEKFCEVYEDMYKLRRSIPKSDPRNGAYKLALNSVYGKSNSKWSFLYDRKYTMAVTINGQLLLAMLAEQIQDAGGQILMINTDGIECLIKKDLYDRIMEICAVWQELTSLELEFDKYSKMFIRDVNNYTAVTVSGDVKQKGAFEVDKWINKDHSKRIVPIAVENYIIHGIPPAITINNHQDKTDFYIYVRCKKTSVLCKEINGEDSPLQRINRLVVTTNGVPMYKRFLSGKKTKVIKGRNLTDINLVTPNKLSNTVIDYDYYITEADKLINSVESFNDIF